MMMDIKMQIPLAIFGYGLCALSRNLFYKMSGSRVILTGHLCKVIRTVRECIVIAEGDSSHQCGRHRHSYHWQCHFCRQLHYGPRDWSHQQHMGCNTKLICVCHCRWIQYCKARQWPYLHWHTILWRWCFTHIANPWLKINLSTGYGLISDLYKLDFVWFQRDSILLDTLNCRCQGFANN